MIDSVNRGPVERHVLPDPDEVTALLADGYTLPAEFYTDERILELEDYWIWQRSWRPAGIVHELQEALGVDQPTVSQQLAVLRTKNIVEARKEGTAVRYTVRDPAVRELLEVTRRIFDNHLIGTQTMLRELRRESRRR